MKTVFINCSPKKRFCASAYFLSLQRLFVGGKKMNEKLRTPEDHERVLAQLRDADSVVFGLPLYVDGVPSHVLRFMEKMETYCKDNKLHLNVYCIANNGFIEGRQNEPLMQVFENFCGRAGLTWGGGGAWLVSAKGAWACDAAKIEVRGTQGGGDTMLAAMIAALSRGMDDPEALRFASAAAAATVMRLGTLLCQKADLETLLPQLTARPL